MQTHERHKAIQDAENLTDLLIRLDVYSYDYRMTLADMLERKRDEVTHAMGREFAAVLDAVAAIASQPQKEGF